MSCTPPSHRPAFTLLEVIVAVAVLGLIYSFVFGNLAFVVSDSYMSRANSELSEIAKATKQYVVDNDGEWPADVNRGIPPGIEDYLGPGQWPQAPWPRSTYDWDNFINDDVQTYQISIRFCTYGDEDDCYFPEETWAEDFDYHSSYYYCLFGDCKAHPGKSDSHPGFCMNCQQ